MKRIFISDLNTSRGRLLAKYAAVILTEDDAFPDEPVVLYGNNAGETANILAVCLNDGDSLFESTNLRAAVDFVSKVKGVCEFSMTHAGTAIEESEEPDSDIGLRDFLTVDDPEDGSDWWKGGDV